jgi:hypothetical protein
MNGACMRLTFQASNLRNLYPIDWPVPIRDVAKGLQKCCVTRGIRTIVYDLRADCRPDSVQKLTITGAAHEIDGTLRKRERSP